MFRPKTTFAAAFLCLLAVLDLARLSSSFVPHSPASSFKTTTGPQRTISCSPLGGGGRCRESMRGMRFLLPRGDDEQERVPTRTRTPWWSMAFPTDDVVAKGTTTKTALLADNQGGGNGSSTTTTTSSSSSSGGGGVATLLSTLWEQQQLPGGIINGGGSSTATKQEVMTSTTTPNQQDIGVYVKTSPKSNNNQNTLRDLSQDKGLPTQLLPVAQTIEDLTGGWALSYADLRPHTETSPTGLTFLATNAAYAAAGMALSAHGDIVLGTMTEMAGAVSLWYHFSQLKYSGMDSSEVRLALLTDYVFAGTALITGAVYLFQMGITSLDSIPVECLVAASASIAALGLSWVWEYGLPYLFWHSLWHLFSAYTAYLVGQAHLSGGL